MRFEETILEATNAKIQKHQPSIINLTDCRIRTKLIILVGGVSK